MVSGRPETLAIEPGSNIEIEVTAEFTCAEPGEFEITYTAVVEWTLTSDTVVDDAVVITDELSGTFTGAIVVDGTRTDEPIPVAVDVSGEWLFTVTVTQEGGVCEGESGIAVQKPVTIEQDGDQVLVWGLGGANDPWKGRVTERSSPSVARGQKTAALRSLNTNSPSPRMVSASTAWSSGPGLGRVASVRMASATCSRRERSCSRTGPTMRASSRPRL